MSNSELMLLCCGYRKELAPFLVGLVVLAVGVCFGYNCGYAINPARDLAPRLFSGM